MEKDKFVLRQAEKVDSYRPIMVDVKTHELLVQMKELSGVSMLRIVAEAVKFASDRLEVTKEGE